jgi:hypothetical protein
VLRPVEYTRTVLKYQWRRGPQAPITILTEARVPAGTWGMYRGAEQSLGWVGMGPVSRALLCVAEQRTLRLECIAVADAAGAAGATT